MPQNQNLSPLKTTPHTTKKILEDSAPQKTSLSFLLASQENPRPLISNPLIFTLSQLSLINQPEMGKGGGEEEEEEKPTNLCDFCSNSKAILYCRADDARLCLSCDRHVHQANSVCSRHPRALLCNSCSSAPSSIFCSSDGLVLCSNCDFEARTRDGLLAHHGRRPVEAFSGCPSAVELVSVLGLGGNQEIIKKKKDDEEEDDYLLDEEGGFKWEMPKVVRLDDLIVPRSDSCCGFQAIGVPPLPKVFEKLDLLHLNLV